MNDCLNADVRDLLPDLLHGRLDEATHARVESHVAGCSDCRAELALLGDLRGSLERGPALNVAAIAAAVPAYRAPGRRSWVGWRAAAAVTLVVAGGSSLVVTQRIGRKVPDSLAVAAHPVVGTPSRPVVQKDSVISGPVAVLPSPQGPPIAPSTGYSRIPPVPQAPALAERELAMSVGTLTDLSDRELTSLLKEIESLDAVPSIDVESVSLTPIGPRRGTP